MQIGIDHITFADLIPALSDSLVLQDDLRHRHHSLTAGVRLCRIANTFVKKKSDVVRTHVKSRRVWIAVQDPDTPKRNLCPDALQALTAWKRILHSISFIKTMLPMHFVDLSATADAMASHDMAGFGGLVRLGTSTRWFQFKMSTAEASSHWPWVGLDMQKHIAAWETLAQLSLTFCINEILPKSRGVVTCIQGVDNSASDAAHAKGLSTSASLADMLLHFCRYSECVKIHPRLTHIPGRINVEADTLSRFGDLTPFNLNTEDEVKIPWVQLVSASLVYVTQPHAKWPTTFGIQ